MRLTFDGPSWRIALILIGLAVSLAGIFMFASSGGRDIGTGGAAVVGLLMVLAGLIGRQTSSSGRFVRALSVFWFVGLPVLAYVASLSTGWKLVLAAWFIGSVAAAVLIARRRA